MTMKYNVTDAQQAILEAEFPQITSGSSGAYTVDLIKIYEYGADVIEEFCQNNFGLEMSEIFPPITNSYRIQEDTVLMKDFLSINYKSELKSGISYTPVFKIHDEGVNSGLLEETKYYRNFVDSANLGELVLVVTEDYIVDQTGTEENSGKPSLERTKTWKHVKTDGTIDEVNTKTRNKKYDTRRKRHTEGKKRRDNIEEQLIDNVGTAGLLSGIFTDLDDAFNKLTALQEKHNSKFSGWKNSGKGGIYNAILNDTETSWLSDTISNSSNQPTAQRTGIAPIEFVVPHMMNLVMRDYISDKLKGNIG